MNVSDKLEAALDAAYEIYAALESAAAADFTAARDKAKLDCIVAYEAASDVYEAARDKARAVYTASAATIAKTAAEQNKGETK